MKTLSLPTLPLPDSAQALMRPMLFAAIGLHGLILFVPLPKHGHKEKPPEQKEVPVKITQLATTKGPAAAVPKAPKALPKLEVAKPTLPKVSRPPSDSPAPVLSTPKPIEAPKSASTPQPNTPLPVVNTPANSQAPTERTGGEVSSLLKTFETIVFPSAQADCFGKGFPYCYTANAGLAAVASHYEKAMPTKKVTFESAGSDAEKKLYKVSNGSESLYLSLLADGSGTVINLAREQLVSLASLKDATTVPSAYVEAIASAFQDETDRGGGDTSSVKPEKFAQPNLFYSSLGGTTSDGFESNPETHSAIGGLALNSSAPPDTSFTTLKAHLVSKNLEVQEAGQYGGGKVYQVKAGSNAVYLNLVPTKDGTGTIAVTWLTKPS